MQLDANPFHMTLSLRPRSLKRYRDILSLFYKYGRGDLVKHAPIVDDPLPFAPPPPIPPEAKELAKDFERLGPTYIKLGQLLSTRSDFVPPAYMMALSKLQDRAEPVHIEHLQSIISVEIGARLNKAFQEFEMTPFATASLGQVHHAVLRNGKRVVVKVQRPDAREIVADDLDALSELAEFLNEKTDVGRRYNFSGIVEELRKSLIQELDYRLEMGNLRQLRKSLVAFPNILVPEPVEDYSSGRILTMEYISGEKITKMSPLVRLDINGDALAEELFRAYLHQILVEGFFHADPHPGNVFLTNDGKVALLDLGMVGRIGASMQEQLLKLLLAISEGQSDRAAEIAQRMGQKLDGFDEASFRQGIADLVMQQQKKTLNDLQLGRVIMNVQKIAAETLLRVPSELTLLGKTLLNLDLVGKTLSPDFDPNASIRRNAAEMLHSRTVKQLAPSNLLSVLLDTKEFIELLPSRLNQFFGLVADNKLRLKVDTFNEKLLVATFQKIANRITLGLILAAMIVGASLIMRVETSFRIFGYPGLAMILFLMATLGGVWLVIQILLHDTSEK